jgi:hypothetical protein
VCVCVCVTEIELLFWWWFFLTFHPIKVSVASVTNTITSIGSHLGVSRFGTFLQWSCVSRVSISQCPLLSD